MKILVVGGYPLTEKRSGSVTHVDKLTQSISAIDNMEVHVLTQGDKNKQFKRGNVNVHVINKMWVFVPFLLPFTMWSARCMIKKIAPDVIHVFGAYLYSTLATLFRNKYPILVTVFSLSQEELQFHKTPIRILRTGLLSIPKERYIINSVPHIIVQSHFTEKLIRGWTKSKIYIVPEGIEYERLQQLQSHTLLTDAADIFIAVNFRKLKGLDILIEALATVIKSVPDVKLYIAGAGEEENELKSLVRELGLQAHVKFLGFISNEVEKYHYYKTCKIVVVPSRWDVEPFAPLDGAVFGKPTIASDACNSSVVVDGKTGFLFKSENINELASKIVKLLTDDKLREEMGKAAMEKAKEYDWSRITDRTVEIYKMVMEDFHERKGKNKRKDEHGKHLYRVNREV